MRLDTNYKEKKEKGKAVRNTNAWILKKLFLNNQQVTDEIKRGNQIISGEKNINENTTYEMQPKQF